MVLIECDKRRAWQGLSCFRPLAGIMVLIEDTLIKTCITSTLVSVPLRGLWFLSAPFINGFMKPSKWHFAGRIIYFHHFSSFARKWFSKNRLGLNFKAAGWNRPACIFKKQVRHINNVCLTNLYYNQHFTTFTLPRKLTKPVYRRPALSPLDFLRFGL